MLLSLPLHLVSTDNISSFFNARVEVEVLRLDRIDQRISGNKLFKLKYYLQEAFLNSKKGIITFGGAWSNHILATAAACRQTGLQSIGIIRGEEPQELSSTLADAKELGMQLIFISRSDYRDKKLPFVPGHEDYLLIPEGGFGLNGAEGASEIITLAGKDHTHYCCAVGTGTTLAGLANGASAGQQVIGINTMKNEGLEGDIAQLITSKTANWQLKHAYHFGGYAKYDDRLLAFMNGFYAKTGIPSDFVYTGKLFYGVADLVLGGFFSAGSRLLIVHSGGLQGNRSLAKGVLEFSPDLDDMG